MFAVGWGWCVRRDPIANEGPAGIPFNIWPEVAFTPGTAQSCTYLHVCSGIVAIESANTCCIRGGVSQNTLSENPRVIWRFSAA